jgi:hypothetical protein
VPFCVGKEAEMVQEQAVSRFKGCQFGSERSWPCDLISLSMCSLGFYAGLWRSACCNLFSRHVISGFSFLAGDRRSSPPVNGYVVGNLKNPFCYIICSILNKTEMEKVHISREKIDTQQQTKKISKDLLLVHWRVTSDPLQVCTIKSRITGIA